jgi:Tol biopolymer transport system component
MSLSAGSKLGPYEILAPLGAGGMGEVYRARDTRLGRDVAVKILPAELAGDAQRLQRFEQEARAISALNHPNVLAIYDVGAQEGTHFLVTELLEGGTLRERMRDARLPVRKAVEIAVQIAEGLAAAHEHGIVHRDLKPDNVIVSPEGRVKILDFGLAKVTAAAAMGSDELTRSVSGPATRDGVVLGTVGYISPEQVRGKPADHRSDVFSFGVILYEMLAGQRAFAGDSSIEVLNAILKEDPPELAGIRPGLSPALLRVVARCVEKAPEERFQSARDLAFALETLSSAPSSSMAQKALPGGTRHRWLTLGVVALLFIVAVAAALVYGIRRGAASRTPVGFRQLNYRRESIFRAATAPDGKTIVYSAAEQGNVSEIYTLSPDYPEARSLGLHDVQLLAVSSKGDLALLTHASYLAHRLFRGTLATMPLGGGAPRELLENVREADWTPDGSALAIIRDVGGRDRLEYPIGNVLAETGGYFSDLRFSPRGDRIAYFDHPQRFDDRGNVAVVDLAGNKTMLAQGYWGEEGIAWAPSGNEIFYSAGTGYSNFRIYAVDMAGHSRMALESAGGLVIQDVLPSGRWLAMRSDERRALYARLPGSPEERDMAWLDLSNHPVLSHNNSILVFEESGGAAGVNYKVCLRRTDGSPVVVLGDGSALDLSPDGRWVLAAIPSDPQQLMLYPTGPGQSRKLERGAIEAYTDGHWFSDGKRIMVCGNERGQANRCYIQDLAGGAPKPITPEGTRGGLVSPDEKRILAADSNGEWFLYPLDGGTPEAAKGMHSTDLAIRFRADGGAIIVLVTGVPGRIESINVADGRRTLLLTLAPPDRAAVVDIDGAFLSDDGHYYAYSAKQAESSLFEITGAH